LTQTETDNSLIVEDVVAALTGEVVDPLEDSPQDRVPIDLRERTQCAAGDVDKRTAREFCQSLLDSLCEEPSNLSQLEALMILGLAHPDVLKERRISLAVEGRRLAILLERAGEIERARGLLELLSSRLPDDRTIDHELAGVLRRMGCTGELVDRYLDRAEKCVRTGSIQEAIPWLQEVLMLDRSRRDVARMIRDLRYQEADREGRARRRNYILGVLLVLSAAASALIVREKKIHDDYRALPVASKDDTQSLYSRMEGLDGLIADNTFWAGMVGAVSERNLLREQLEEIERSAARVAREKQSEKVRLEEMADEARLRGLMNFEHSQYEKALDDFERALTMCSPNWEHKKRVTADVKALRELLGEDQ
jgi:tetratricopeptide (TPR) repeat protein